MSTTPYQCVRWVAGTFAALLFIAITGLLGCRAYRQQQVAQTLVISSVNGINEAMFVKIGGIDQYVQIRGEDRNNPVLLIVHGGPGVSLMAYTPLFRSWEKYFTVVQWDQRGDGKTFGQNGTAGSRPMTINQMSLDGIDVSRFLLHHLHQPKLIVLGHSWGSILALRMAKLQPDLFSAYVGTGQIVAEQADWAAGYTELLGKARAAQDLTALGELQRAGPPPYKTARASLVQQRWLDIYGTKAERELTQRVWRMVLVAPNYSLSDIYDFWRSARFSHRETYDDLNNFDARQLGRDFKLPFYIIDGDSDLITPASFARQYFNSIQSPRKEFVLLRGGGHTAMLTMPDRFLDALLTHVRPLASR
jgi:pimeloyl-ACP methyl ester carboxylesterase